MNAIPGDRRAGFLDESRRGDAYALAAVLVADRDRVGLRREAGDLLLPGERRFHMAKERPARRRQAIEVMRRTVERGEVVITSVRAAGSEEEARRVCLEALVLRLERKGADRLCIERRDETRDRQDRRIIRSMVERRLTSQSYEHRSPTEERLLWFADILAWAATSPTAKKGLGSSFTITRVRS